MSRFVRYAASRGCLYSYSSPILRPFLGAIVAWSLLLAYVATGSSVIGGFYHYGNLLILDGGNHIVSAVILGVLVNAISVLVGLWDVKVSACVFLGVEGIDVSPIVIVVALGLFRFCVIIYLQQF